MIRGNVHPLFEAMHHSHLQAAGVVLDNISGQSLEKWLCDRSVMPRDTMKWCHRSSASAAVKRTGSRLDRKCEKGLCKSSVTGRGISLIEDVDA